MADTMNFYELHDLPSALEGWDVQMAPVKRDGEMQWWKNGVVHRDEDLPARIQIDPPAMATVHQYAVHPTYAVWCQNGQTHRDGDRPAIVERDYYIVTMKWCQNGKIHRDGAPAIIFYYKETGEGRGWDFKQSMWFVHGTSVAAPAGWVDNEEEHFGRTEFWAKDWKPESV